MTSFGGNPAGVFFKINVIKIKYRNSARISHAPPEKIA